MNWFDRFLAWILRIHGIPDEPPVLSNHPSGGPSEVRPVFVPPPDHDPGYWVFTREYDEECTAAELIERLSLRSGTQMGVAETALRDLVDPANPLLARARHSSRQRIVQAQPAFHDAIVTILIDHSGSMRGASISTCLAATVVAIEALARAGIGLEVLGFSTRAWKGGQSRDKWLSQGRPTSPGRLCDLRHIIYRSADEASDVPSPPLALMLVEGILRENIDGEALQWAAARLRVRPQKRKLLIVLSDSDPTDDSTVAVNRPGYLLDHLHFAAGAIEADGAIILMVIGVGRATSTCYSRSVTVSESTELPTVLIDTIVEGLKLHNE